MKYFIPLFCHVLWISNAYSLPSIPTGFYQTKDQSLVYIYTDLIPSAKAPTFGTFGVNQKKQTIYSEINEKGDVVTFDSEQHPLQADHYTFLGTDPNLVSQHLGSPRTNIAKTVYLAHRGLAQIPALKSTSVYPGNTLPALELALQNGYDGFEIDIQLSKDKKFIVSHDQNLEISTDCQGKISEMLAPDILKCSVKFTGLLPESTFLQSPAKIESRVPSLQAVFNTYLTDSRVKKITLDTKPGDIDAQIEAFYALLSPLSEQLQSKIIFLIRDLNIETRLKALGFVAPIYAWEGSKGWEPLQDGLPVGASAVSVSLGMGLGISPQKDQGIMSLLLSLPEFFIQGTLHGWVGGSVDIASIQWIPSMMKRYKEVEGSYRENHIPLVAWSINTESKIRWLRDETPGLNYVISDLPYAEIAKLQLKELELEDNR